MNQPCLHPNRTYITNDLYECLECGQKFLYIGQSNLSAKPPSGIVAEAEKLA